jgi:glycosyltransferase involved in cell wall biosynthesis
MASENEITIAYAGTLRFENEIKKTASFGNRLKSWFWTYQRNSFYAQTRSALPLFTTISKLGEEKQALTCHLWGDIDLKNQMLSQRLGVESSVIIEGYLPKDETVRKLKEADILYLPLELNPPQHQTLYLPGKLFEYLWLGKPILAFAEDSDCKDILIESGLGMVFSPFETDEAADFLRKILLGDIDISRRFKANSSFINSFSFDRKAKELAALFDQLVI